MVTSVPVMFPAASLARKATNRPISPGWVNRPLTLAAAAPAATVEGSAPFSAARSSATPPVPARGPWRRGRD